MRHSKLTCLWFILSVANALFVNEDHNPPQSLNGSSFNIYYRSICSFRERWLSSAYFLALLKRISLPSGCRDNRLLIGDPAQETVINVLTLDNKFAKQITAQFGILDLIPWIVVRINVNKHKIIISKHTRTIYNIRQVMDHQLALQFICFIMVLYAELVDSKQAPHLLA
eukprot:937659_1